MEDELVRGGIAAGTVKHIVVQTLMPGTAPDYLKATAAIYEDGAIWGTAYKVKLILDARRVNLQFTRELIRRIEKSISPGDLNSDLMRQLAEWAPSTSRSSRAVITYAVKELKDHRLKGGGFDSD